MSSHEKEIDAVLRNSIDPLAWAEDLTGCDVREDGLTAALGISASLGQIDRRAAAFKASGDNYYETSFDQLLQIALDEGFSEVLSDRFPGMSLQENRTVEERAVVLWHPDAVLLWTTSFGETRVNTAEILYSWRPFEGKAGENAGCRSNGSSRYGVWTGTSHDVREGLRFRLRELRRHGSFLNPWEGHSYKFLITYEESERCRADAERLEAFKAAHAARIARLPEHVRLAMGELIRHAIERAGRRIVKSDAETVQQGLGFVQFEGPWEKGGARAAYRYTHWVGLARRRMADEGGPFGDPILWVYDAAARTAGGWLPLDMFDSRIMPEYLAETPRSTGWRFRQIWDLVQS